MKKSLNTILFLFVLSLIIGCTEKRQPMNRSEFFAWMDAYIAVEKQEENSVAVTMFFEDAPYAPDEIANISFIGIQDQVVIDDFRLENMELPNRKYSAYGITLTYTAQATGIFHTPGIIVTLKSNEAIPYPIGSWTFDVGERGAGKVNAWEAPVASAYGTQFPYQFTYENTTGIVKRMDYGPQYYIQEVQGIPSKGTIDLHGRYSSPIVYIKPKFVISEGEREFIDYGIGCYCGAIHFSEEVIEKSKIHNSVMWWSPDAQAMES